MSSTGAPVGVGEIDLESVYGSIGLRRDYRRAIASIFIGEDPNRWNVFVPKGMNHAKLIEAFGKASLPLFNRYEKQGWDRVLMHTDRNPDKGDYVVSFLRNVEADKASVILSGDEVVTKHPGECITLLECGLLELGFWYANGKHLDNVSATLCAGTVVFDSSHDLGREKRYPYRRFMSKLEVPRNLFQSCAPTTSAHTLRPRFVQCYRKVA